MSHPKSTDLIVGRPKWIKTGRAELVTVALLWDDLRLGVKVYSKLMIAGSLRNVFAYSGVLRQLGKAIFASNNAWSCCGCEETLNKLCIKRHARQTQGEKVSCREGNSPWSLAKVPKMFYSLNEVRIYLEQDYRQYCWLKLGLTSRNHAIE